MERTSEPEAALLKTDGSQALRDGPESKKLREMTLQEIRPWLSSPESGYLIEDLQNLFRCRQALRLILDRAYERNATDTSKFIAPERVKSIEVRYIELAYATGQEMATLFGALRDKTTDNPIRFSCDPSAELTWRSFVVRVAEAAEISGRIPHLPVSQGLIIPDDNTISLPLPTSRRIQGDWNAEPSDAGKTPVSVPPKPISLDELWILLTFLGRSADSIHDHFVFFNSYSSGSNQPRLNRLGLSELQLDILRALYPDRLLSATSIAEKLGISANDSGKIPFLGHLKPQATLRKHGLIGTQRGIEGGYFVTEAGRKTYEEYAGIDSGEEPQEFLWREDLMQRPRTGNPEFEMIVMDSIHSLRDAIDSLRVAIGHLSSPGVGQSVKNSADQVEDFSVRNKPAKSEKA